MPAILAQKQWQKQKFFYFSYAFLFTLPFLIFLHNLKAACYNCFNASDLGIYAQALYDMAAHGDLNPTITVRGIKIFNDHFDPILLLVSPITRLFSYHIAGPLLLEILWVYATMALIVKVFRNKAKQTGQSQTLETLFILGLLLFSKGLLVGLHFPIHPTTWSIFPCFLLVWALYKNELGKILWASLFVCFFKEDFPFAIFGLSFAFLVRKERGKFFSVLGLAVFMILVDFVWRPQFLGLTYSHGDNLLKSFLDSPLGSLVASFRKLNWGTFTLFYPFILPLGILVYKEIKSLKAFFHHPLFATVCFLAPLIVIRILANAFQFHYSAPLVVTLLSLLAFSTVTEEISKRPKWAALIFILFMASSSSVYTKMVQLGVFNKAPKCIVSSERKNSTQKLKTLLKGIGENETLLSTGGVLPQILGPKRQYFHLGGLSIRLKEYDYLLLETQQSGDTWPLQSEHVNHLLQQCRPYAQEILLEDSYYILMKGKIPQSCLNKS